MKKRNILMAVVLMVCLVFTNIFCFPQEVFAKKLTTVRQAQQLAKKKVKGAKVLEAEKDYENGVLVYEIQLRKGKKEYDLIYRASDSKLIGYGWEIESWYVRRGTGKIISISKCKKLAKKQVSNGKISSIVRKRSEGVDVYNVKMQKGSKRFELKIHARTGKLLEYDWELISTKQQKNYIGEAQARKIALAEVGGGQVVKSEFDMDNGVPVYEVEVIYKNREYDLKIHAETGVILEIDID